MSRHCRGQWRQWRYRASLLLGALMVCPSGLAAAQPQLAYAQWLLDSGEAFEAALVLSKLSLDGDHQGAAGERKRLLVQRAQEAIDRRIGSVSGAAARPQAAAQPADVALRAASAHWAKGQKEEAVAALQSILKDDDGEQALQRQDVIRLQLGRIALQGGDASLAREHYRAIRSPGPYSSQALLELGWSYLLPLGLTAQAAGQGDPFLAPNSLPLRVSSPDALAALRRETPFRTHAGIARNERAADLASAARVWQELIGRDPLDPAVQEGKVALAYAFQHMGDNQQALRHYGDAVELLSRGRGLLGEAIGHVRTGSLLQAVAGGGAVTAVGWPWWVVERRANRWWIGEYRSPSALFYAPYLMADSAFAMAVERLQLAYAVDAELQQRIQAAGEGAVTGAMRAEANRLQAVLAPAILGAEAAVERRAVDLLEGRRTQLERVLAEAHFALARMREPSDVADASDLLATGGQP